MTEPTRLQTTRPDRRLATVLFADIVGSTKLVARMDPEEARDHLQRTLQAMGHQVARFGGTLCQTMGDGILAVFGAPAALEDHTVRAFMAGDAITREGRRLETPVRVGIAVGEILWDKAALSRNDSAPAVGFAVHLAAKLQSSAPVNGVMASAEAVELASSWVDASPAGPIAVATDETISAFTLLGIRRRTRRPEDAFPPVGRTAILGALGAALEKATRRISSTHLIAGPPGIGKSRVARAVVEQAQRLGLRVIEWQQHPVRPVGAPPPLAELLSDLLDRDCAADRAATEALLAEAGVAGPGAAALCDLVSDGPKRSVGVSPDGLMNLAADAIATLAARVARAQPLLLLVEDLHWAGTDGRTVVVRLSESDGGFMLLATSRDPTFVTAATADIHALDPLDRSESAELLDLMIGPAEELQVLKDELAKRCDGNPFFIREYVRSLVHGGALTGHPGAFRSGQAGPAALPKSVHSLLVQRIDGLEEEARDTLLKASVIGVVFDRQLLASLLDVAGDDPLPSIEQLERAGVIDRTRILPRLEYSFSHALLHEAAYRTLTHRDRKSLHGRLVNILQTADFSVFPDTDASVARHAYLAEQWEIAITFGWRASNIAFNQGPMDVAMEMLNNLLVAQIRIGSTRHSNISPYDAKLLLGRVNMQAGDPVVARRFFQEVIDDSIEHHDTARLIEGLLLKQSTYLQNRENLLALETGMNALSVASRSPENGKYLTSINVLLAHSFVQYGDYKRAYSILDSIPTGSRGTGVLRMDEDVITSILTASCLSEFNRFEDAHAQIDNCLSVATGSKFAFQRVYALSQASIMYYNMKKYNVALNMALSSIELSKQIGALSFRGIALAVAGSCLHYHEDFSTGLEYISSAAYYSTRGTFPAFTGIIRLLQAECAMIRGDLKEAGEVLNEALEIAVKGHCHGTRCRVQFRMAEITPWRRQELLNETTRSAGQFGMHALLNDITSENFLLNRTIAPRRA